MGFTVPLLIVHAALPAGPLADSAIPGLLCATVIAALSGGVVPAVKAAPDEQGRIGVVIAAGKLPAPGR